jgi:hypothetical protein
MVIVFSNQKKKKELSTCYGVLKYSNCNDNITREDLSRQMKKKSWKFKIGQLRLSIQKDRKKKK